MIFFRILKKFRQILNRHQKVRIIELGVIMVIGGFMEMLSVSLIMPFMQAVMDPDELMGRWYVQKICIFLGIESSRTFLVLLAFTLAIIYVLKNLYLLLQMRVQNRFVFANQFMTKQKLLHNYLSRPYEYYLGVSSGEILRVINDDTGSTFATLTDLLMMTSELVVSGILMITIFAIAPVLTLAMGVLMVVMMLLVLKVIQPILRRSGKKSLEAGTNMNKWLIQSIQGIKEMKITRKQEFFEKNYEKNGWISVKAGYNNSFLGAIPRFLIEAAAMSGMFLIIGIIIYRGTALETLIPIISTIAVAAVRLLPSINRISASVANMTFREPMVDKMIENLKEIESYSLPQEEGKEDTIQGFGKDLALSGICYRYPKGETDVLSDASMTVQKGQSVGIVGPSGAGKTTAVDIMLGLLRPQDGKVLIDGTDIRLDMDGWLSEIGYIPQQIFMLDADIRENVAFGVPAEEIDDERVWKALKDAAMDDYVRTLPDQLQTQLGERGVRLSGGQRQRISIARALYTDPSVLFFDEATSALDNETEAAIMDSINHLHGEKTMIIIAHRLSTIEGCDHVFRVEGRKIRRER